MPPNKFFAWYGMVWCVPFLDMFLSRKQTGRVWGIVSSVAFSLGNIKVNLITAKLLARRILVLPSSLSSSSWPHGLCITLWLLWLYFICLNRWRTEIILRRWVDHFTKSCFFFSFLITRDTWSDISSWRTVRGGVSTSWNLFCVFQFIL